ncbi:MAG: DUF456 domain-containing protein [Anaerolineae bacterium]|nr:DUF456 domain-containing protein [Thermoflexales bacterium]MDW8395032.1 DUF456 domain-containing protein [Anaerolineae bacterium]
MPIVLLDPANFLQAAGLILMFIGLVGVFLPVLPGLLLIWIGALVWSAGDGFQRLSAPALAVMGIVMVAGWAANWWMTASMTRREGASWLTVAGAIIGGVVGGVVLTFGLPVIGSVIGAVLGGIAGVFIVEGYRQRRLKPALKSGGRYLAGCVLGQMLEMLFALIMLLWFVVQATGLVDVF